jgi:hypothetical protein
MRLQEAGISKEVSFVFQIVIWKFDNNWVWFCFFSVQVLNSAIAQFCLEIIARHGDPAPRLCNKDPLTLKMGSYVIELFPQVSLCHLYLSFHLNYQKLFAHEI